MTSLARAGISRRLGQDLTTPQAGQHQWDEEISSCVPQKGHTVSAAGSIVRSLSFNERSLGVRSRCAKTRIAPNGAPIRITQVPATISGSTGMAQKATAKISRTNKPSHLNVRRVLLLTCGWWPQTEHIHRCLQPNGTSGIQKTCHTSKVRILMDRRGCSHVKQKSLRKAKRFGLKRYIPWRTSMATGRSRVSGNIRGWWYRRSIRDEMSRRGCGPAAPARDGRHQRPEPRRPCRPTR